MSQPIERTEAQREAARINGAKSCGPVTDAGKAISSQNARKHGLAARKVVLEDEDQAEYAELLADYRQDFAPVGRSEEDLVRLLALYQFRLDRAIAVTIASTNLETLKQDAVVTELVENPSRDLVLASAVEQRHRSGTGEACFRYENHFSRLYNRTLKNLRALQKDRLARDRAAAPKQTELPPQAQELCSIQDLIEAGDIPSLKPGAELTAWERRRANRNSPHNEPEPDPPIEADEAWKDAA